MLSLLFTSFQAGLMAIFAVPIAYIVVFQIIAQNGISDKHMICATLILVVWCVFPLFYMLIAPIEHKIMLFNGSEDSMTFSSFGGFSLHRNYYGFYVGLSIILLTFYDVLKKYRIVLYPLLLIGLILSESRSSIIATLVCVSLFYIKKNGLKLSRLFMLSIGVGIIIFLWYYFSQNFASRDISSNSDRWELYNGFFNIFWDNFFWGTGKSSLYFSSNYPEGSPAHNFILQTLADYGFFTSLIFFFFIGYNFFHGGIYSKTLWCYLLIIGLFQPYFTFGIPISFTLITFLMIAGLYRKSIYGYN
ncbi:MAG: O-antigen ligase family protein [Bacteroidales bacterium]